MQITRRAVERAVRAAPPLPTSGSMAADVITTGIFPPDRLATGVRDGTKFLRDDGTWQVPAGGGGGSGGLETRATVALTTASLLNNASEAGVATLGKSFLLLRVSADRPSRVRLYTTSAALVADAARMPGTDPVGEHGVIADLVFTGINLTLDLAPVVLGTCLEGAVTTDVPYSITNVSGATSPVAVTFTRVQLESAT